MFVQARHRLIDGVGRLVREDACGEARDALLHALGTRRRQRWNMEPAGDLICSGARWRGVHVCTAGRAPNEMLQYIPMYLCILKHDLPRLNAVDAAALQDIVVDQGVVAVEVHLLPQVVEEATDL